jgi:hypothetical protein
MRKFVGGLLAAALLVIGIGLLPPLFARKGLDRTAAAAARAGSAALSAGVAAADAAAGGMIATHKDMKIVSMGPVPGRTGSFAVTVQEHVHTFLDRLGPLAGWFTVTSTRQASTG